MTLALYPTIRGLTWPVKRTLEWDTEVQKVSSGKELRTTFYTFPINHWELVYNYLKDNPADPFNPYSSLVPGNFVGGLAGWSANGGTIALDTASPFASGYSLKMTASTLNQGAFAPAQIPVVASQPVYLSAWLKSDGTFKVEAEIDVFNSSNTLIAQFDTGSTLSASWANFSVSALMPANAAYVQVYLRRADSTGGSHSAWAADVSLSYAPGAQNVSGYSDLQFLEGFYNQQQGRFGAFLFTDATDNSVIGQQVAIGDGTTTTFQLVRTRGGFTEPVQAPQAWNIYLNGVPQSSGYTVSSTGVLTFTTAPGAGVSIIADISYCWNVRFDDDSYSFEQFAYQLHRLKMVKLAQVKL
jgi:uncharacterized protein (TIGR02217 family)